MEILSTVPVGEEQAVTFWTNNVLSVDPDTNEQRYIVGYAVLRDGDPVLQQEDFELPMGARPNESKSLLAFATMLENDLIPDIASHPENHYDSAALWVATGDAAKFVAAIRLEHGGL